MKSTQTIRQKTGTIRSLCLLIAVFAIAVILIPVSRNAATSRLRGGTLLSPGLSVLAEQHTMAMAGIVGESIQFEAADFAVAVPNAVQAAKDAADDIARDGVVSYIEQFAEEQGW